MARRDRWASWSTGFFIKGGPVYRARDEKPERTVAIKLLTPGFFRGEDARGRFHGEALALAKLSHAHIAAIYDVGEQHNVDCIVMECVAGEPLAADSKDGPLSVKEAHRSFGNSPRQSKTRMSRESFIGT